MSFLAECPVCRTPLPRTYFMRTAWSRWTCRHCGSLLGINIKRRLLGVIPLFALMLPLVFLAGRVGLSDWWGPALLILFVPPVLLLVDRAVVVERCGFRCRDCGYDLQGQVTPRCPECGREFDEIDRRAMETGVYPEVTQHGPGRHAIIIMTIVFIALTSALLLGVYYTHRAKPPAAAAPMTPAASQPGQNQAVDASQPVTNPAP